MSARSQFALLAERRFLPYFVTQFLGAFNDNVFRNGFIILVTFQGVVVAGLEPRLLANVAGALFILPFFLFSATAGQLADKYDKSLLIRRLKLFEVVLMTIAAVAFLSGMYLLLLGMLFLAGLQSTLFGPVKYAYLPQQLAASELVGGNALVEAGTYIAIMFGLIAGGMAVATGPASAWLIAGCLVVVALGGYLASRGIPPTGTADPELQLQWNAWRETLRMLRYARRDRAVFLSILGISWFWFVGSALTIQVPAYAFDTLRASEEAATVILVCFAIGVGSGSLLCEKFSGRRIELGLVPFGAIGLSVFAIDLYFAQPAQQYVEAPTLASFLARPGTWRVLGDVTLLGMFGGFYSVPLYALIQQRAEKKTLSRVIAANNILNALFIVAAAILAVSLFNAGLSIPQLFIALALLNAAVAAYIFLLLPEFLIRFLAWILINLFYRIRVSGLENVPTEGPAVLVCNHVSYADAMIVGGTIRRPVRFVMYFRIFEIPILKLLFSTVGAIPIASAREDEKLLERAFERIDAELAAGNLVCIFPEGEITRDGHIHRFRHGVERILERRPVPVVPIALRGMWGSWFSRRRDGGLRRIPGRLFARIDVLIGSQVRAGDATPAGLELLVRTLRGPRR